MVPADKQPVAPRQVVTQETDQPATGMTVAGHSPDYRTLCGKVRSFRGNFRLRYADASEDDRYGGSVSLEGVIEPLRDGYQICVQGQLIPAADRFATPRFQVKSIEVLSR